MHELWSLELEEKRDVGGCFALTNHPFLTGRPSRAVVLEQIVAQARGYGDVWVASLEQIATHVRGLDLAPRTVRPPGSIPRNLPADGVPEATVRHRVR